MALISEIVAGNVMGLKSTQPSAKVASTIFVSLIITWFMTADHVTSILALNAPSIKSILMSCSKNVLQLGLATTFRVALNTNFSSSLSSFRVELYKGAALIMKAILHYLAIKMA